MVQSIEFNGYLRKSKSFSRIMPMPVAKSQEPIVMVMGWDGFSKCRIFWKMEGKVFSPAGMKAIDNQLITI